jgi:hypothetical protein
VIELRFVRGREHQHHAPDLEERQLRRRREEEPIAEHVPVEGGRALEVVDVESRSADGLEHGIPLAPSPQGCRIRHFVVATCPQPLRRGTFVAPRVVLRRIRRRSLPPSSRSTPAAASRRPARRSTRDPRTRRVRRGVMGRRFHLGDAAGVAFWGTATLSATFADRGDAQQPRQSTSAAALAARRRLGRARPRGPLKLERLPRDHLGDAAVARVYWRDPVAPPRRFRRTANPEADSRRSRRRSRFEFNTRRMRTRRASWMADFLGDRPLGYVRRRPPMEAAEEDRYLTVVHKPTSRGFGDDLVAIGKAEPGGRRSPRDDRARRMGPSPALAEGRPPVLERDRAIKVTAKSPDRGDQAEGFAIAVTGEATYRFRAGRDPSARCASTIRRSTVGGSRGW